MKYFILKLFGVELDSVQFHVVAPPESNYLESKIITLYFSILYNSILNNSTPNNFKMKYFIQKLDFKIGCTTWPFESRKTRRKQLVENNSPKTTRRKY